VSVKPWPSEVSASALPASWPSTRTLSGRILSHCEALSVRVISRVARSPFGLRTETL